MKRLFQLAVLPPVMLCFFSTAVIPDDLIAENFPVYNLKGERSVFYKIIDSMPDNSILIMNFTSVTCIPCRKELPELKRIAEESKGSIRLMCIFAEASDTAGVSAVSLGVSDCTYVDPFSNIQKLYNVKKYPVTFIINKNYKILGKFEGYTEENIKKIKKLCGVK